MPNRAKPISFNALSSRDASIRRSCQMRLIKRSCVPALLAAMIIPATGPAGFRAALATGLAIGLAEFIEPTYP